jgi:tRNA A37 threonylcarbamoyladenosine biosynthesis protein TsaE
VGGPGLVHADAYRLGDVAELDDLDLDASLDKSVIVVEWGRGLAETLADSWLDVRIDRLLGDGSGAGTAALAAAARGATGCPRRLSSHPRRTGGW